MKSITSINNEHIKELCKLKDKKYRDEVKLFLVEGYNLVNEAKDFLTEVLIVNSNDCINDVTNILVTPDIINKLSTTKTPQNIIGVCKYFTNDNLIGKRFLLLDSIQDPGNLGTLIRSSLGFNIDTIIASLDTVDVYNEKVLRATQGSIFHINYLKKDLNEIIPQLKKNNITVIGTSLKNAIDINDISPVDSYAIVLGNEGNGISDTILKATDMNVKINIGDKLESLNVSIAGSIVMFYLNNIIKNRYI